MRISDWSSDVCSSDLAEAGRAGCDLGHDYSLVTREGCCSAGAGSPAAASRAMRRPSQRSMTAAATELPTTLVAERPMSSRWSKIGGAAGRERVWQYV